MEPIWWRVKVFEAKSQSTTTIDKLATSEDDIRQDLEEEGLWMFVSAVVDDTSTYNN